MGSQDEQANLATSIINNALQNVANYCTITCNNNISNLDITIIGGNDTINISQQCSIVGSECMIKNIISSQITNLVKNMVQQEESNLGYYSLLGPSSSETTNISNAIKNQMTQLISNTCAITADNSLTNSSLFAQDANLNFTISQVGNLQNSQCNLDTVAKMLINNDLTNTAKQSESSCGNFLIILILIIVIVVIIIVFPAIAPAIKGVSTGVGAVAAGAGTGAGRVASGAGTAAGKITTAAGGVVSGAENIASGAERRTAAAINGNQMNLARIEALRQLQAGNPF